MAYAPLTKIPQQFFDNLGNPLVSGTLYAYLAGTSTPTNMFSDNAGTVAGTSVVLDSRGEPTTFKLIWLNTAVIYKFVLKDSTGTTIWTIDNIDGGVAATDVDIADTGSYYTATTVEGALQEAATGLYYKQGSTGSVATTVQAKLRETVSVKDFGAVGDGTTDDTTAIQNWLNFLILNTSTIGYWNPGTYSVNEGSLVIQPPSNVDWPGIRIETAGYKRTILKGRGTSQAPMLTIQNLTQTSGAGKFLKGGKIGPLGFDGSAQNSAWTTAHGISLRGIDGWEFGYLYGESLKGDLVRIPQNLYSGNNPDPYHVAFCVFLGLQSNFGNGWVLNNDNYVGFTSNEILNVACYGVSTGNGAIRTCGAGNIYKKISVGTCWGWAIHVYDGSTGGRASRETFSIAELDDPQYGIYIFNNDQAVFDQIRIVHRYHAGIGYWPREALRLSDATNPSLTNTLIDITHRIESGGVKADLGGFIRAQGSNAIEGVEVVYKIVDNAGFGLTNSDILSGANINSLTSLRLLTSIQGNRTVAFDNQSKPAVYVTLNAAASIPSGGFSGAGNNISTTGVVYDRRSNFSSSTFTAPVAGLYRVFVSISISGVAAGVRFRFGLRNNGTGNIVKYFTGFTTDTGKHVFNGSGFVDLAVGDQLSLNADNNSGLAVTVNTSFSAAAENSWSIELVESAR